MQNLLVTGANGFIGKALCRRMLAEGRQVRGAIRTLSSKTELPSGMDAVEVGNIGLATEWETALEGIDTVVHLAARVHVMDESTADPISAYREVNLAGTRRLAQMAAAKTVQRFVYVSSIKVNGEGRCAPYTGDDRPAPVDPYGISKLEAEQELLSLAGKTGLEVAIIRPPLVYGPEVKANFLQLIKIVDRSIPLPLAGAANQRSMIFLENLVDALCICTTHPAAAGQTFLVSDGEDLSTSELILKISSALGKPARLFPMPPAVLRFLGRLTGKTKAVSRLLESLCIDSSKICNELNWKPPFSMEEGLKKTADWYLQAFAK